MWMSGTQNFSRGTETDVVPHSFSSQLSPSTFHRYGQKKNTNVIFLFYFIPGSTLSLSLFIQTSLCTMTPQERRKSMVNG